MSRLLRVGIVCNRLTAQSGSVDQSVREWGARAVAECGPHLPLLIPALPVPLRPADILDAVDGLLFPGGVSNVGPGFYGAVQDDPAMMMDPARDHTSLPLMSAAIAAGVPVFCICRGVQELNVVWGGSLFQAVHKVPGRCDHREHAGSAEQQFSPAHDVTVMAGGLLSRLGLPQRFAVNSLHGQGIDRLAPALKVEAQAPDGQIEAVSMPSARGFVLGVQWHPEWRWSENAPSRQIFAAFSGAIARNQNGYGNW